MELTSPSYSCSSTSSSATMVVSLKKGKITANKKSASALNFDFNKEMNNSETDSLVCSSITDSGSRLQEHNNSAEYVNNTRGLPESISVNATRDLSFDMDLETQYSPVPTNDRCLFISELQSTIDGACNILYKPWKSEILMDMCLVSYTKVSYMKVTKVPKTNIMQFASKNYSIKERFKDDGCIVYFDVEKYPVSIDGDGFDGDGYKSLSTDLGNAGIESGFYLVKNGFKDRQGQCAQEFTCNRYQCYRGDLNKKRDETVYRGHSYRHDKSLSRGKKGLNMPRMTTTMKPLSKENTCKFCFYVTYDNVGFYVIAGGKPEHSHHPKLNGNHIDFPTRFLSGENIDLLKDVSETNACSGVAINLIHHRTGKMLSRQKIRYISGLCKTLQEINDLHKDLNSTEKMIQYLKKKKFEYMILLHDDQQQSLVNEVTNAKEGFMHEIILPTREKESCFTFALQTRRELKIETDQQLLMGLAWVNPKEVNLFGLFPEVIFCDVIADVNKDQRPLLTCTGKDCNGKMYTFLRAFLPNEKQWVFRWIFSHVFPRFFSTSLLSRVKVIITDGCVQEFSQIDDAMFTSFKNAYRVRCGFHIIRMGWKNKVLSKNHINNKEHVFYNTVCFHLKQWLYSWMKSTCDTEKEYQISKLMFYYRFMNTSIIKEKLGLPFIDSVKSFVRDHVEPHENHYCFYMRRNRRHFDEYSNSLHEGTNNGIRHASASIGPCTNIEKSLIVLNQNGARDLKKKNIANIKNYHGVKLYAKLRCSKHLVATAYSMIETAWARKEEYSNIRVSFSEWYVVHNKFIPSIDDSTDLEKGLPNFSRVHFDEKLGKPVVMKRTKKGIRSKPLLPIVKDLGLVPKFKHIRKVKKQNGVLKCSCCFYERFGIPCSHLYNVVQDFKDYDEPSHHEVSVRWWSSYSLYASNTNTSNTDNETRLVESYAALRDNESEGLPTQCYSCSNIPIRSKNQIPHHFIPNDFPVCLNFPLLKVNPDDLEYGDTGIGGLSQVVSNYPENEIDDVLNSVLDDACSVEKNRVNSLMINNPYPELLPYFKDMTTHMAGYCTEENFREIKSFFQSQAAKFKGLVSQPQSDNIRKHKLVSSSVPSSKKKKAHGTRY